MTKRPADAVLEASPTDPNHPWVTRGYRPDFAPLSRRAYMEDQDPYGEVAYQRAFWEAIEQKSRRVPDPVLYHNSPSARDYIARRDKAFFSHPGIVNHRSSNQRTSPSSSGTPTHSPKKPTSPLSNEGSQFPQQRTETNSSYGSLSTMSNSSQNNRAAPPISPRLNRPPTDPYRPYPIHGIPLTLEPKLNAPTGPSRMLR